MDWREGDLPSTHPGFHRQTHAGHSIRGKEKLPPGEGGVRGQSKAGNREGKKKEKQRRRIDHRLENNGPYTTHNISQKNNIQATQFPGNGNYPPPSPKQCRTYLCTTSHYSDCMERDHMRVPSIGVLEVGVFGTSNAAGCGGGGIQRPLFLHRCIITIVKKDRMVLPPIVELSRVAEGHWGGRRYRGALQYAFALLLIENANARYHRDM